VIVTVIVVVKEPGVENEVKEPEVKEPVVKEIGVGT
jgi:hypothetical protein